MSTAETEAVKPTAAVPDQSIEDIAIDRVIADASKRRALNDAVVADLMQSIASVGLLEPILVTPIGVTEKVSLVAGQHRLEACKRLNHERIKAVRLDGIAGMVREEIEIVENLCRAELSAAERASHLLRLKRIYEAKYPDTRKGAQGGGRAGKGTRRRTGSGRLSFSAATAAKTGRSKRSVERDVRRAKQLGEGDIERIKGTSLSSQAEMDALIELPQNERAALIERARTGGKVSAVSRAIVIAKADKAARAVPHSILPLFTHAAHAIDELRTALGNGSACGQLKALPVKQRTDFRTAIMAVSDAMGALAEPTG